jgi:ferredoxin
MIITKQKDFRCVLDFIGKKPVFLIGCSECATVCNTGGEKEIKEIKEKLENEGVIITGWVILEPACNLLNDKRILKGYTEQINNAKKIVIFACGNGVQTVSEILSDVDIFSGTDTLFLGEVKRIGDFEKRCDLCGECIQDEFDSFCPIARCPKKMMNGPCGGSISGKCEIDSDLDCVWALIYNKLKAKGRVDKIKKIVEPKDWSKSTKIKWRSQ